MLISWGPLVEIAVEEPHNLIDDECLHSRKVFGNRPEDGGEEGGYFGAFGAGDSGFVLRRLHEIQG